MGGTSGNFNQRDDRTMLRQFRLGALLVVALAVTTSSLAQGTTSLDQPGRGPDSKGRSTTSESINRDVAAAVSVIQGNYAGAGGLDYNKLFTSSINAMLHTLDPHSNYLDPLAAAEFSATMKAEYSGIGVALTQIHDENGGLFTYIQAPFENSPAHSAGLKYGDQLVEIDGVAIPGKSFDEVRSRLIGPIGTKVKILIEHHGNRTRELFEITRDAIPQRSVPIAYILSPGVGYILLTNFSQTTGDEFRQAMADLHRLGMEYLVLDLRNNFGGLASQAVRVANTFLPKGRAVFTTEGRQGKHDIVTSDNKTPDPTPIVVLINDQTASSGEILSGALQDNDRAFFVGSKTYGKGLIQVRYDIQKTSALLLTIARYKTPSGRFIQRDYANGSLYNYYRGGAGAGIDLGPPPKATAYKTTTGRTVYGGGGVAPDITWTQPPMEPSQIAFREKLRDPIFAFSMDLALGNLTGFDGYRITRPIVFNGSLKPTDFPITYPLFESFRQYAAKPWKVPPAQIDREREYIERLLRVELATAAFGTDQQLKVANQYDRELIKAFEFLPQAKRLAEISMGLKAPK